MQMAVVVLGEVAEIERRVVPADSIADGTTYVGLEHMIQGGGLGQVPTVTAGELASAKFAFTPEHVLYGKLRPNLSKVARPAFAGVCSTDILPIRPGCRLDRNYLGQFLLSPDSVRFATERMAGANLPRISPELLATLPIPLPALAEQRRIAAILDRSESLRELRKRGMAGLGALDAAAYNALLGDPRPGANRWPEVPLRSCTSDIRTGPFGSSLHQSDYVSGGVPVINPMHIRGGLVIPGASQTVGPADHARLGPYHLREGDVVLGRRGEMGRAALVRQGQDGFICGTGTLMIRPDEEKARGVYLAATLRHATVKRRLEDVAQGQTLPNLNANLVGDFKIPVPPLELQAKYEHFLGLRSGLESGHRAHLAKLDELFASLQYRAFRGAL